MYPITAGLQEAKDRINNLLKNGHHSEALVTSVFTLEKTIRRVLRQLIISTGFNSVQADRYLKKLNGIHSLKEHWEFFDPHHRKLPDIIGSRDWNNISDNEKGYSYMRNQMIHGIRVYKLSECKSVAESALITLDSIVSSFDAHYGYDGWSRATSRKTSALHSDPKVKI